MYLASPIEAAVQSVRGVKKTSSESTEDGANLTIELEPDADVQIARLGILERLELLRADLPAGVSPPQVSNFVPPELEEEPLIRFTLAGPYTAGALQKIAEDDVQPRLAAIEGVAGIDVRGGTDVGVTVSYDPSLLRQRGLSPDRIGEVLTEARMVRSLGLERQGSASRAVALRDQPNAVEQLSLLPIRGPGNRIFRLGELANVRPDEDSRGFFFRIDGQPVERRRTRRTGLLSLGGFGVIRSATDRSGMIVLVTLTSLASLLPLAIGTDANSLFGAIALATAGGTLAGTIGAMFVLPMMVLKRRLRAPAAARPAPDRPSPKGAGRS